MIYNIVTSTGQNLLIEAERFVQDGSGTTLYGVDDEQVSFFFSGQVLQIVPADVISNEQE